MWCEVVRVDVVWVRLWNDQCVVVRGEWVKGRVGGVKTLTVTVNNAQILFQLVPDRLPRYWAHLSSQGRAVKE